jgi:energy-coupling factor transport system ATP-binding protein
MTARQPQILVLDEPLSMLDTTAALEFIQALDTAREGGQGFVICEHRHEYVRMMRGLDTLILDGHPPDPPDRVAECTDWQGDLATADQFFDRPGQRFVLQAQKLTVVKGGNTLLRELSFELAGGRVVAIVGRNGAGKTTLLRAVAGLQRYEGELKINGAESGRPSFGMVFQNPDLQLFNATVREEILYRLPDPDLARYQWLMAQLHLQQYEEQAPLLLSEGEKRRVALATTLMHAPRHGILLDEPSLGQDIYHKKILIGVLRSLSRAGMLVVMATHDMELACAADEILLLQAGALLAHGPTSEILAVPETWRDAGVRLPDWISHPC